jgi:pimeloyl-ACP methyl ester carboxylesterase
MSTSPTPTVARRVVELADASLESFRCGDPGPLPLLCAAHPAEAFGEGTLQLLAAVAGSQVASINPRGLGASSGVARSLEQMVDDLELARLQLGLAPWVFWGMSGGGWLAQLYAHRHPAGLRGIVLESICACFRLRLADPDCALSPYFPAYREALSRAGLLDPDAHTAPSVLDDPRWTDVPGAGAVLRQASGPALLVSPVPLTAAMRQALPWFWAFDSRGWLSQLALPTLVIAGTADPIVPTAHVRALHTAIAGSRWLAIEGAGHVPSSQQRPEAASALRAFLSELASPR